MSANKMQSSDWLDLTPSCLAQPLVLSKVPVLGTDLKLVAVYFDVMLWLDW